METNDTTLAATVQDAKDALAAETAAVGSTPPAEIGSKSEPAPAPAAAPIDLTAQITAAVTAAFAASEAGAKAQADEQAQAQAQAAAAQATLASTVDDAVKAAFAARLQTGRKTPAEGSMHNQTIHGATFIPADHLGDSRAFSRWLGALGRKGLGDLDAVKDLRDIYANYGGKTLSAEGGGATTPNTVSGPNGGYLVPPQFAKEMIDFLYAYTVLRAAGVSVLPVSSNIYYQPRLAGTAAAAYVGENTAIGVNNQSFDQFQLTMKKLAAFTPITAELVYDSDPAIEQIVRSDLMRQLGLAEDLSWLVGVGSSTVPQGILTASGTTQTDPTDTAHGDAASYDQLVNLQTTMAVANVPQVRRVWICHPSTLGAYRLVKDGYGRPLFSDFDNAQLSTLAPGLPSVAMKPAGTLFNLPIFTSSQIPLDTATDAGHTLGSIALVEISQVLAGQRGTIEMNASVEATFIDGGGNVKSAFQSDLMLFRALMRHDIGLLHPAGVAVQKGIKIS